MGLFLTDNQKREIQEALYETNIPCRDYLGRILDIKIWAKVFSNCSYHDDIFMAKVIEDIKLWMNVFPKGSNIPNPSAYVAQLYEFMCEDNDLTNLGAKMLLDKMIKSRKQIPSISEVVKELQPIKEKYLEFKKSSEEFMQLYQNTEQRFFKQLDDVGITKSLSDVLDFKQLSKAWHTLFPYDPFPGCNIWTHPFRPDKDSNLVINALSKPRHENPLLMVFMVITEIAQKEKIIQYNMEGIYEEMARLYPEIPSMRGEPNVFYLPSQWGNLNLSRLKPDPEHDTSLFDNDELIYRLIHPESHQNEIINYIKKITYDYFIIGETLK